MATRNEIERELCARSCPAELATYLAGFLIGVSAATWGNVSGGPAGAVAAVKAKPEIAALTGSSDAAA